MYYVFKREKRITGGFVYFIEAIEVSRKLNDAEPDVPFSIKVIEGRVQQLAMFYGGV